MRILFLIPTAILPIVITVCGVFMLFKTRFFFFLHPIKTLKLMFSDKSQIAQLSLSLAGTLGVGNIVGVAMAISLGGAGAVFWMWVSAVVSAVLKYAEITLAVKYRTHEKGGILGGPMYYMKNGIGGKFGGGLAAVFSFVAVLLSFVMGNLVQSRAAVGAAEKMIGAPGWAIGVIIAALCAASIFRGYSAVTKVTTFIVPIMSGAYILIALYIIISNAAALPRIVGEIFSSAFDLSAAGGGILGFLASRTLRHGVAKGAYSHEAGGGTAPLSHAQTKIKSPAREGLLGLFEVFFDTLIICTLTAFVILLCGKTDGGGSDLVYAAFSRFCGAAGGAVVSVSIMLFAFSTLICWGYYGKTCLLYLCKSERLTKIYLALYSAFAFVGAVVPEGSVWVFVDFGVSVMTAINLAAVVMLWRDVRAETDLLGLAKPRK